MKTFIRNFFESNVIEPKDNSFCIVDLYNHWLSVLYNELSARISPYFSDDTPGKGVPFPIIEEFNTHFLERLSPFCSEEDAEALSRILEEKMKNMRQGFFIGKKSE